RTGMLMGRTVPSSYSRYPKGSGMAKTWIRNTAASIVTATHRGVRLRRSARDARRHRSPIAARNRGARTIPAWPLIHHATSVAVWLGNRAGVQGHQPFGYGQPRDRGAQVSAKTTLAPSEVA